MSKDILIRDVPDNIHAWIEEERYRRRMTKQDFIFQVLENASRDGQPSLFDRMHQLRSPHLGNCHLRLLICLQE